MDSRIITVIAAVVGIPIVLIGYLLLTERLVGLLPRRWQPRVRPYLWILPAVAFATVFMVIPTFNTILLSFQDRKSEEFVGLANYQYFFTNPGTTGALKNSLFWLVFLTSGVVIGGLLIAVLFDRVRYEPAAKLGRVPAAADQRRGCVDHLEVHVRVPARGVGPDGDPERPHRGRRARPRRLAGRILPPTTPP